MFAFLALLDLGSDSCFGDIICCSAMGPCGPGRPSVEGSPFGEPELLSGFMSSFLISSILVSI